MVPAEREGRLSQSLALADFFDELETADLRHAAASALAD
jgi:hypothetical protein